MGSITSANAILTMSFANVFPSPVQLQGFDVDDIYDIEAVDVAETKIGVDGVMSSGYIFFITPQTISLQADSASVIVFETVLAAQKANQTLYPATGTILLPAIGRKYTMTNGVLKNLKQAPGAKKVLQPRLFRMDWEDVAPSPYTI